MNKAQIPLSFALLLALGTAGQAGVYQTPAGGWGVQQPIAPAPKPAPKTFGSAAGGSPDI